MSQAKDALLKLAPAQKEWLCQALAGYYRKHHLVGDSDLVLENLKYEVIIYLLSGFFLQGGPINLELSTTMRFYCDFFQ